MLFVGSLSIILFVKFATGKVIHEIGPLSIRPGVGPKQYTFAQKLDHYSGNSQTWGQRYFYNDEYVKNANHPVFLLIGGEGPASIRGVEEPSSYNYWAFLNGALMINLEHRFYGESKPTSDVKRNNLQYLTSSQALGDISNFIRSMNKMLGLDPKKNKWILFGGSYPANLATWARKYYPDVVYGAIASSGPLEATVEFPEYKDIVRDVLNKRHPGCGTMVRDAAGQMLSLIRANNIDAIKNKFKLCSTLDPNNRLDVATFMTAALGIFNGAVQDNGQTKRGVDFVCKNYMLNAAKGSTAIDRVSAIVKENGPSCVYSEFNYYVQYFKMTGWDEPAVENSNIQWAWQCCNEFGYFQVSKKNISLARDSIPIEYYLERCRQAFGLTPSQVYQNIRSTNLKYGGRSIQTTNVVFTQNNEDPWYPLGIPTTNSSQSPFYFIEGTSHCYDQTLGPDPDNDDPSLTAARNAITQKLRQWLQ